MNEISSTSEQCIREKAAHKQASEPGEGCRLSGHMMVNKVSAGGGKTHVPIGGQQHSSSYYDLVVRFEISIYTVC